jgi:hypothetical protein
MCVSWLLLTLCSEEVARSPEKNTERMREQQRLFAVSLLLSIAYGATIGTASVPFYTHSAGYFLPFLLCFSLSFLRIHVHLAKVGFFRRICDFNWNWYVRN